MAQINQRRGVEPLVVLIAILAVAAIVRGVPVLGADFPLHDGGLFYVMASELRDAGFVIPVETSFNHADIPFAYPPLGLAIAGLGLSVSNLETVFRVLPWIYSVASVASVYWLARELRGSAEALLAALGFALIPHSFDWLIAGGGVTRGLGLALATACVASAIRCMSGPTARRASLTGILGGLTVLAHPEATVFAAISAGLVLLVRFRRTDALLSMVSAGAVALVLSSPWWATVISNHGPEVLINPGVTRDLRSAILNFIDLRFTGAPFLIVDVFLFLAVAGAVHQILRGQWFLIIWAATVFLLMPGAGTTYTTIPLAILGASVVVAVGLPVAKSNRRATASVVAVGWVAAVFGALTVQENPRSPVDEIQTSDRVVMERLAGSDLEEVAVLTGRMWWGEGPGEWFPALSGLRNPVLVQGYEWLGSERWERQLALNEEFQECAYRSVDCLVEWMQKHAVANVFVSASVEDEVLRAVLDSDPRLRTLVENGDTAVVTLSESERLSSRNLDAQDSAKALTRASARAIE